MSCFLYYYDSSQKASTSNLPTYDISKPTMTMTFHGKLSGATATIGVESFAGVRGYVHPDFVKRHRLHIKPCVANITLGDGKTNVEVTEECIVHLSMGSYSCKVWALVLPLPEPYDMLLGDERLKENGVRILYDKQGIEIVTRKRKHTIPNMHARKQVSYTRTKPEEISHKLLSFLQYRRTQTKGNSTYVCYIQTLHESENTLSMEIGDDASYLGEAHPATVSDYVSFVEAITLVDGMHMIQKTTGQMDTLSLSAITRTQCKKLKKKVTWASPEVTSN